MFGFVSPGASSVADSLGARGLTDLHALAQLHADGWGWAGIGRPGERPEVVKSMMPAEQDASFQAALDSSRHAAMLHLRWATVGIGVEQTNTHPFVAGDITFEHNGALKPIDTMRALLSPRSRAALTGATDSEMYFALILELVPHEASVPAAVARAARTIRQEFPVASLNAMLLTPEHMIVVHSSARSALDEIDLVEAAQFELPDEHAEDYFALRWSRTEDGTVLVASSGLSEESWAPLPTDTVMAISLTDGSIQMLALDATAEEVTA
ncbi:class II glutamine amidotransferase [Aeromicrobium endophyticum]|uniref:Class II glutamine amidotransferase n=1 Tax=Aeromicrobium endophyticum TaxID=2292704 RepID=A0A371P4S9_9ACTN|nr:class II glutamine amidotransferase [Aeromicrobium endophyticum]REK70954.1 class II glutamine amidotransferase [Aeromicrobium endophyticum]